MIGYALKINSNSIFTRTAESLIDKVNVNTSNLSDLQNQLEKRVGKQVDIREAILKKKDEKLKGNIIFSIMKSFIK